MAVIVFDIDGTYTQFEKFVLTRGIPYAKKHGNLQVMDESGYDFDEVFTIILQLQKQGMSIEEATARCKKLKDNFWTINYPDYCLVMPFRKGVRELITKLKKDGHTIINVSSRFKTCREDILGSAVRTLTQLQFLRNGVPYDHLVFVPDDDYKLEVIRMINPILAVDDKPELITAISEFSPTVCINSSYNLGTQFNENVLRTTEYDDNLYQNITRLINNDGEERESSIVFQKKMLYLKR